MDDLDTFWTNMLSRDPTKILPAWETLSHDEQAAVYTHLQRMVTEEGWAEPQRRSAQAALVVLAPRFEDTDDA